MNSYQGFDASSYLEHYGVKGMKWRFTKNKEKETSYPMNGNDFSLMLKAQDATPKFSRVKGASSSIKSSIGKGKKYVEKLLNVKTKSYTKSPTPMFKANGEARDSRELAKDLKNRNKK